MKLNIKNWKTTNKTPRILVTMKSITEDKYANQYANALSGDDSNFTGVNLASKIQNVIFIGKLPLWTQQSMWRKSSVLGHRVQVIAFHRFSMPQKVCKNQKRYAQKFCNSVCIFCGLRWREYLIRVNWYRTLSPDTGVPRILQWRVLTGVNPEISKTGLNPEFLGRKSSSGDQGQRPSREFEGKSRGGITQIAMFNKCTLPLLKTVEDLAFNGHMC